MSRSCKEYVHHNPDFIEQVCLHCSWPEFVGEPSNFKPKPITKADSIRAMTDEELADLFSKIENGDPENHLGKDGWLDWLKRRVVK